MIPFLDGLLKLAIYPADSLPGRFGVRLRRLRLSLRRSATGAVLVTTR